MWAAGTGAGGGTGVGVGSGPKESGTPFTLPLTVVDPVGLLSKEDVCETRPPGPAVTVTNARATLGAGRKA